MGSVAGGGVVVLGVGQLVEREGLALLARASGREQGGHPVELELVGDADAALARLARCPDAARVVVIDPSWAAAAPDEARRLCLTLAFETRSVRIVLWGEPTSAAMHGVALCARWVSCELVVRGVEDGRLAEVVSGAMRRRDVVSEPMNRTVAIVERMPTRLRGAWGWVMLEPEIATVKGVAGRVGLTRRSLEWNVFRKQDSLGLKSWGSFAAESGVRDTVAIASCATEARQYERIERGKALGDRWRVTGTPTILVNEQRFRGAVPDSVLTAAVERALARRR